MQLSAFPRMHSHLALRALAAALLFTAASTPAALITESYVGGFYDAVPDNGVPAVAILWTPSSIASLTGVDVHLVLSGDPVGTGWAGDIYASLNLDLGSKTAVLLNQVGVQAGDPLGLSYDGWDVTFRDGAAAGDVHNALPDSGATSLTGIWQADGRVSPEDLARPLQLGTFSGESAADKLWYLTLADLSPGGSMVLQEFSLTLTGYTAAVPEPGWAAVATGASLAGWVLVRRRQRVGRGH